MSESAADSDVNRKIDESAAVNEQITDAATGREGTTSTDESAAEINNTAVCSGTNGEQEPGDENHGNDNGASPDNAAIADVSNDGDNGATDRGSTAAKCTADSPNPTGEAAGETDSARPKSNDGSAPDATDSSSGPTRSRPHCKVHLLDGECIVVPVNKKANARVVINEVLRHVEVASAQEMEYFSVYYIDASDCRIFLNPFKQIRKQLPKASSKSVWELYFGVQFYATELTMLPGDLARYLYVLQICKDLKDKRISVDHSMKVELAALLVQANCGDYDPECHLEGYTGPFVDMIYNQAEIPVGLEHSISDAHKEKAGFTPSKADTTFFMMARSLYKFGQHIFPVQDRRGQSGEVGASITGLVFHKDGKQFLTIGWADIVTLSYRRKKLRVKYHPKPNNDSDEEVVEILYLRCTEPCAKIVWRACVEQHTFFRLERPKPAVKSTSSSYYTFNRGSELRFSRGKTLYQMMRSERIPEQKEFVRTLSLRYSGRGLPARDDTRNRTIIIKSPEESADATDDKSESPVKETSPASPDANEVESPREDSLAPAYRPDSVPLQQTIDDALKERNQEIEVIVETMPSPSEDVTVTSVDQHKDDDDDVDDDNVNPEPHVDDDQPQETSEHPEDTADNPPVVEVTVLPTKDDSENIGGDDAHSDDNVVEFSEARQKSSFMVVLEESYIDDDDDGDSDSNMVTLEGKYRNDSIISNDLGPAAHYIIERMDHQSGETKTTELDLEVRTPSPTYNEEKEQVLSDELKKLTNGYSNDSPTDQMDPEPQCTDF